jgi:hypothetical protein
MTNKKCGAAVLILFSISLLVGCGRGNDEVPESWKHLVKTEGQHYPIPSYWLDTPEGRIAHSLVLPDAAPKPVPFDFEKAAEHRFWEKKPDVAFKYFQHLCATEAGEWIFKKVEPVEGLYFARPKNMLDIATEYLSDPYGPEAPGIERRFQIMGESAYSRGINFVSPPFHNFSYVEEPRRDVEWQKDLVGNYIRIFGNKKRKVIDPLYFGNPSAEHLWYSYVRETPMEAIGISEPTAIYAMTWRGITRPNDRRNGVSGVELIIYERATGNVILLRRSFVISGSKNGEVGWLTALSCKKVGVNMHDLVFSEVAERGLLQKVK